MIFDLHVFVTAFGVGDVVYNVTKARRGVLERVVIKLIRAVNSRRAVRRNQVLYQDTLNGLWNEDELVPYRTAMTLAKAYYQRTLDAMSRFQKC